MWVSCLAHAHKVSVRRAGVHRKSDFSKIKLCNSLIINTNFDKKFNSFSLFSQPRCAAQHPGAAKGNAQKT
ncbi:MAG: hypothetical protein NZ455_16370 [Bacteroidia bacterium]|nr:hypothetical protein [Bacteroidia bacterium]MDW8348388.1 hypothetical protein [Bacteroidia bacterium]